MKNLPPQVGSASVTTPVTETGIAPGGFFSSQRTYLHGSREDLAGITGKGGRNGKYHSDTQYNRLRGPAHNQTIDLTPRTGWCQFCSHRHH
jgi:hypothetical protein